jgi:hypothetical protein
MSLADKKLNSHGRGPRRDVGDVLSFRHALHHARVGDVELGSLGVEAQSVGHRKAIC